MTRSSRGFTLLEVAVALAIMGVGVVTVLELFSAGLKMENNAGVRARAVVYARGLLDQTMTLADIHPGNDRGRFDDTFRWEVAVREAPQYLQRANPKDLALNDNTDFMMYEVEVSVLWVQSADREGVYSIRTLRLVPHTNT